MGRPQRDLVICCDGTWISQGRGQLSSIGRIAQLAALSNNASAETEHNLVFYSRGVGTNNFADGLVGGGIGDGMESHIVDAYHFLVHNYVAGDRIFLFGFSRGAFTVRCLAGMLDEIGLLKREHAIQIHHAYRRFRRRMIDKDYPIAFVENQLHRPEIQFLGVFDTVGAAGVPIRGLDTTRRFRNHLLPAKVRFARHALAINEPRSLFLPTVWEGLEDEDDSQQPIGDTRVVEPETASADEVLPRVKQVWFAGVHGDVGGAYARADLLEHGHLGRFPFEWMLQEAKACGFTYDPATAHEMISALKPVPEDLGTYVMHDSMAHFYWIFDKFRYLSRVITQGDTRFFRRYIEASKAVDQSIHESALNMYLLDRDHTPGGTEKRRLVIERRTAWLWRGPRHFRFSRNREMQSLEAAIREQLEASPSTADIDFVGHTPITAGAVEGVAFQPRIRWVNRVARVAIWIAAIAAALYYGVILGGKWLFGTALPDLWDAIVDVLPSDLKTWLIAIAAIAIGGVAYSFYLTRKRLYGFKYLR
ncbi:MAG: DUF2235 domain-containing protein [Solirubrobacterales bacterium]